MLFCAEAVSRVYNASVRYHSWTIAPFSQIANASPSVLSMNASSGPKSAVSHADGLGATVGSDLTVGVVDVGEAVVDDAEVHSVAGVDARSFPAAPSHADSRRAPARAPIAPASNARLEVIGRSLLHRGESGTRIEPLAPPTHIVKTSSSDATRGSCEDGYG